MRTLQGLTKPLNQALKSLSPSTEIDSATDQLTNNVLKTHGWGTTVDFRWQRCTLIAPLGGPGSTTLRMSRALELLDNGTLFCT